MGDFPPISRPMDRVGMDLIELPISDSGNKYVLTIVDHFTCYLAAYPLQTKQSEEVTAAVLQYITTYGAIHTVVSDRGTEFTSRLFQRVCNHLEIKYFCTTAYNPAANGKTERYNRTLKQTLAQLVGRDRGSWDANLKYAVLAINSSYQDTIKDIPFFLFHGRDADIPLVKLLSQPRMNYSLGEDYAAEVIERLHLAFDVVKKNAETSHEKSKRLRGKETQNENISVGSLVLLRNERQLRDDDRAWPTAYEGPHRVLEKTETGAKIRHIHSAKEEYVHLHRLKVYMPREGTSSDDRVDRPMTATVSPPTENIEVNREVDPVHTQPCRYNLRRREV